VKFLCPFDNFDVELPETNSESLYMPIFEYACDDCGTSFEKLVRRSGETEGVACPSCGKDHLTRQYSTFSARASAAKSEAPAACGTGMCGSGFCGTGACGMN
jgi:putative FmdB family regulatory protein